MYLRNYKGKIVYINEKNYPNERDLYIDIWKIKYNINIAKNFNLDHILNYVDGEISFL